MHCDRAPMTHRKRVAVLGSTGSIGVSTLDVLALHPGQFEVVVPSLSVEAECPVAVVDKYAERRGTREAATEYLSYLWSPEGQAFAVRNGYRPRGTVEGAGNFPELRLVTVDEAFEGWSAAQRVHFDDGGIYDDITTSTVINSRE